MIAVPPPTATATGLRGRLRLVASTEPWRAAGYLLSYLVVGTVCFAVIVTALVTAGALVLVWVGVPLLLGAAALVRAAAHVERQRSTMVVGVEPVDRPTHEATHRVEPVGGAAADIDPAEAPDEATPAPRGLLGAVARRGTDPSMAPSLGYLVGLYPPLLALDAIVVSIWLALLGGITIPLWYWAVPTTFDTGETVHGLQWGYFPHGPDGPGAVGLYIDDPVSALVAAAVCAVLFVVVACPLATAAARLHARIATRLLGAPDDPLAEARAVLRSPGPLAVPTPRLQPRRLTPVPPVH